MMQEIDRLIGELEAVERGRIAREYPALSDTMTPEAWTMNYKPTAKVKSLYVNIDIGDSGAWMVEKSTGNVFGIRGYGVADRRKYCGRIENIDGVLLARCRWTLPTCRTAIPKDTPGPVGVAERNIDSVYSTIGVAV